jgi:hypothetical protein
MGPCEIVDMIQLTEARHPDAHVLLRGEFHNITDILSSIGYTRIRRRILNCPSVIEELEVAICLRGVSKLSV